MSMYDMDFDVSSMRLQRLGRAIPFLVGDGSYAGDRNATLSSVASDAVSNGLIDLSNPSGIITVGAIPPSLSDPGFAFTFTDTTAVCYWDGTNGSTVVVIRRVDQTRQTVPPNNITMTGLTASTWYGLLPYWAPGSMCNVSWVPGTVGTPKILFDGGTGVDFTSPLTVSQKSDALAQQLYQGREALSNGFMTFKTAAGGGSGGGPAGDGGGDCVMRGTHIETLGDLPYSSKLIPETSWWRVIGRSGRSLNCTPNHQMYNASTGKVRADSFKVGQWAIGVDGEDKIVESFPFKRTCVKEKVMMQNGHLFWANGFLGHNFKPAPQAGS